MPVQAQVPLIDSRAKFDDILRIAHYSKELSLHLLPIGIFLLAPTLRIVGAREEAMGLDLFSCRFLR